MSHKYRVSDASPTKGRRSVSRSGRDSSIDDSQFQPSIIDSADLALPTGWEKLNTVNGTPYYRNSETLVTQWIDPRLSSILTELKAEHNFIKHSVYRTASTLLKLQQRLGMSSVQLSDVMNTLRDAEQRFPGQFDNSASSLSAEKVTVVLMQLYSSTGSSATYVEVMVSWLLLAYDRLRSGEIPVQAFKIALIIMSSGYMEEKYRAAFSVLDTNNDGCVAKFELGQFITLLTRIVESIGEGYAFVPNPAALDTFISQCSNADIIHLDRVIAWTNREPDCIAWVPILHRLGIARYVRHGVECSLCDDGPIAGFRYSCENCQDINYCQICFWQDKRVSGCVCSKREFIEYCSMVKSVTKSQGKSGGRLKGSRRKHQSHIEKESPFPSLPKHQNNQSLDTVHDSKTVDMNMVKRFGAPMTVSIKRTSSNTEFGFGLGITSDGYGVITSVAERGPAAGNIMVADLVFAINGSEVSIGARYNKPHLDQIRLCHRRMLELITDSVLVELTVLRLDDEKARRERMSKVLS